MLPAGELLINNENHYANEKFISENFNSYPFDVITGIGRKRSRA